MDEVQLHHVAEQRCKHFGCSYIACLKKSGDQSQCMHLFRSLQMCKADQMEKIKQEFEKTGMQPQLQQYRPKTSQKSSMQKDSSKPNASGSQTSRNTSSQQSIFQALLTKQPVQQLSTATQQNLMQDLNDQANRYMDSGQEKYLQNSKVSQSTPSKVSHQTKLDFKSGSQPGFQRDVPIFIQGKQSDNMNRKSSAAKFDQQQMLDEDDNDASIDINAIIECISDDENDKIQSFNQLQSKTKQQESLANIQKQQPSTLLFQGNRPYGNIISNQGGSSQYRAPSSLTNNSIVGQANQNSNHLSFNNQYRDYTLKYDPKTQLNQTSFNQNKPYTELFKQRNPVQPQNPNFSKFVNTLCDNDEDALLNKFRKPNNNLNNNGKPEKDNYYGILFDGLEFKTKPNQQPINNQQNQQKSNNGFVDSFNKVNQYFEKNSNKQQQQQQIKTDKDRYDKITKDDEKAKQYKEKAFKMLGVNNPVPKKPQQFAVSLPSQSDIFLQKKRDDRDLEDIKKAVKKQFGHKDIEKEMKQMEQVRKKEEERKQEQEQFKQKQKQENKQVLDDLFGFNEQPPTKVETKSVKKDTKGQTESFEDFMQNLQKEKQAALQNDINAQKQDLEDKLRQQQESERDIKLKQMRFHNRKKVDELIKPILNFELIEMFQGQQDQFEPIPLKFESFQQYKTIWMPLFLYETYNQLINQRTESDKEKEQLEASGLKFVQKKKTYFEGYITKSHQDMDYIYIKLFESKEQVKDKKGYYNFKILDSLKEFDLLLICDEPLPTNEVKKITNAQYLLNLKQQKGKMLCVVSNKRKKDQAYIELKMDARLHEEYACINIKQQGYQKMHIYYFDSLVTIVREFRTIKSCEFFPTASIILNPSLINTLQNDSWQKDEQKRQMNNFLKNHRDNFNQSQCQALEHVSQMKKEDFLLIQGPPGTGKTHTIQGIISMLVYSNVQRILICGPSNAAIDEIVLRIATQKLFGVISEEKLNEKLLRIGSMDYDPLPLVRKFTLDEKLRQEMGEEEKKKDTDQQKNSVLDKLQIVKERVEFIITSKKIIENDQVMQEKARLTNLLKRLYRDSDKVQQLFSLPKNRQLENLQKLRDNYEKEREALQVLVPKEGEAKQKKSKRSEIERKIIQRAQIICTTLSMSGSEKLELIQSGEIEYLIIDEACQCVELTNLIPFDHNPQKVILVGDQQQLPATTFSENSEKTNYSRSLFERFLLCDVKRFMLGIQYRMHPLIREFPSNQFYEGKLEDAQEISRRSQQQSNILDFIQDALQNLIFFDLKFAQENSSETSKQNKDEALFIEAIFNSILRLLENDKNVFANNLRSYDDKMSYIRKELQGRIGVITPYKSQVRLLKDILYSKLRELKWPLDMIEINTVDAYQGREKDIIIISCVRSSQEKTMGFLNDYRRMNVAITRAKSYLWVIGNSKTLKRNKNWKDFIRFAKQKRDKGCYYKFKSKEETAEIRLQDIFKPKPRNSTGAQSKSVNALNDVIKPQLNYEYNEETKFQQNKQYNDNHERMQPKSNNEHYVQTKQKHQVKQHYKQKNQSNSDEKTQKFNGQDDEKKRLRKLRFKEEQSRFQNVMDQASPQIDKNIQRQNGEQRPQSKNNSNQLQKKNSSDSRQREDTNQKRNFNKGNSRSQSRQRKQSYEEGEIQGTPKQADSKNLKMSRNNSNDNQQFNKKRFRKE